MAKILVVDDSEIIRVQLRTDLTKAGHEVLEAEHGLHGLEVLNSNTDVDIIISDVNMPEMDGVSMCQNIHSIDTLNHIPIVMLTTQSSPELKAKGKEYGVIAWVTKPYKSQTILKGIEKILSKLKA